MKIAMSHGINWNWFLVFSIEDGELVRHYEGRLHKGDDDCRSYAEASSYSDYRFDEDPSTSARIITHCRLNHGDPIPVKDGPLPRFTNGYLPALSRLELS